MAINDDINSTLVPSATFKITQDPSGYPSKKSIWLSAVTSLFGIRSLAGECSSAQAHPASEEHRRVASHINHNDYVILFFYVSRSCSTLRLFLNQELFVCSGPVSFANRTTTIYQ